MENTPNDVFTQEDIEISQSLHTQLNDIIISIKDEQLAREEREGGGGAITDQHRMEAYGRVANLILKFSAEINEYIYDLVFDGVDVSLAEPPAPTLSEGPVCPECDHAPCGCDEADNIVAFENEGGFCKEGAPNA